MALGFSSQRFHLSFFSHIFRWLLALFRFRMPRPSLYMLYVFIEGRKGGSAHMWHMYINILQLVWLPELALHINNASHPLIAFYLVAFNRIFLAFPPASQNDAQFRLRSTIFQIIQRCIYVYTPIYIYSNAFFGGAR